MKKKKIVCGVVASVLALSATLSGCSALTSANSNADMKQTIATVNISKAEDFSNEGLDAYKDAVGTTSISKRELISYFLNVGYSYINAGYGYKNTFNMLVDTLVNTAVMTQYSVMYLLKEKETEGEGKSATTIMSEYNAKATLAEKYEYVLGGKDSVEVKLAEYSLRKAINNAIDSYEENILDNDDDDNAGSATRTTPGNVDTEQDKYYPQTADGEIDYNIYTGYAGYEKEKSGTYEEDALDGTTPSTRKRAYVNFLASINSYNLIDVKNEDMRKVRNLQYIEDEYVNQLEQQIINKYYEVYEGKLEKHIKDEDQDENQEVSKYDYIKSVYEDKLKYQQDNYKAKGFTSTLDNMSDSSFILYVPDTKDYGNGVYEPEDGGVGKFGFVYNILLPFNALQSAKLSELKSLYSDDDEDSGYTQDYYYYRNQLLEQIETTDQRAAWFNGSTEYAFNAKDKVDDYYGGSDWLFFENNLLNPDKYESLEKYAGKYSYNGKVIEKEDGYVLIPEKLNISKMLNEFSGYVNYVLETSGKVSYTPTDGYYTNRDFYTADHNDDETNTKIDYSKFLYGWGEVEDVENTVAALYDKNSTQYKAMTAVNELQYAYTTDTGVLSNYIGYSVDAADTNYIKEFEYAAQFAISKGAGTYAVCAGDYGWHLIYVTCAFEAGNSFNEEDLDWENNIDVKGTFENLFYEWIKSQNISDISSTRQTEILTQFNIEKTVTKYQKTYQDLLDLG